MNILRFLASPLSTFVKDYITRGDPHQEPHRLLRTVTDTLLWQCSARGRGCRCRFQGALELKWVSTAKRPCGADAVVGFVWAPAAGCHLTFSAGVAE